MKTTNQDVANAIMLARKAILCRDLTAILSDVGGTGDLNTAIVDLMETFARNGVKVLFTAVPNPYIDFQEGKEVL